MSSRQYLVILVSLIVLDVLKAYYLPNLYAINHYLLSFEQGFTKRGFLGELLRVCLGDLRFHYSVLCGVAFFFFLLFWGFLVRSAWKTRDRYFLLFLAAPTTAFLFSIPGYLDFAVYGFGFVGAELMKDHPRYRGWILAATCCLTIVVHEMAALTVVPFLFFLWLVLEQKNAGKSSRPRWPVFWLCASVAAFVCLYVSQKGVLTPPQAWRLLTTASSHADFEVRRDVFETVAVVKSADYFPVLFAAWKRGDLSEYFYRTFSFAWLFAGLFLTAFLKLARHRNADRNVVILAFAAVLAPLPLNLIATDLARWQMFLVINSFLVLSAFRTCSEPAREEPPLIEPGLIAILIVFGLLSYYPLFMGASMRQPPYSRFRSDCARILS